MLSPYRVLDLTDQRGELAGMLLGDFGADVIKVEPRGGCAGRSCEPLLASGPDGERSLQFRAYNRNKRSIEIDWSTPEGRKELLALVAGADFILESAPPSLLEQSGIDFHALCGANPKIVSLQITPFGADGPYADWPAADLTIAALAGPMSLQGVAERAPVRVSVPQVWRHTGAEAAGAALIAHALMLQTGEAQRVDVSAQATMTWTMMNGMGAAAVHQNYERMGSILQLGVTMLPCVSACKDGYVVAASGGATIGAMVDWLMEEGAIDDPAWREEDWDTYVPRLLAGETMKIPVADIMAASDGFLASRTKAELLAGGLERAITIAPVNSTADLLAFDHLADRGAWEDVSLPDGRTVRGAGQIAHSTLPAQAPRTRRPAPRLDEHGDAIREELASRTASAGEAQAPADSGSLPFEGLKIADLTWVVAGPATTRYLADHGASIVRVETESKPCATRLVGPYKDGQPGTNRSHFFGDYNAGKRCIAVDFRKPEGLEIVKRLIAWADVLIENYRPGVMDRLGLGYDVVRELNPSIVMLSTSLMGEDGSASHLAGYGYHAGAISGYYELTGWPDLAPDGPWLAYTDTVAPRFQLTGLLAALDHRRRTGEGQHISFAQLEAGLQFLAPEVLEVSAGGESPGRIGNRSRFTAPEGAYPCAGDDQWCAIAVETDAQWSALKGVLGHPEWAATTELDTVSGRLERHDEIDEQLSAWTRERDSRKVMEELVASGVPAGMVQRSSDLLVGPQLRHRGFWRELEHPEIGESSYAGPTFRIAGYDAGAREREALFNEHTLEVLSELGMSDEEIAEGFASGAIG
jgi:crotonobetainyl-CoA:carnitine CoA-transferase CaiB-like acyl-CoA transferase